jgi:hypothetical protein
VQKAFSNASLVNVLTNSPVRASATLNMRGSTIEYRRFVPSFRHLTMPASFRIFRCLETRGWIRFSWGTIWQTHFSPSRR